MPFMMTHYIMLQRDLLYTDVIQAKKILVLIVEKKGTRHTICNNKTVDRNTRLSDRIQRVMVNFCKLRLFSSSIY